MRPSRALDDREHGPRRPSPIGLAVGEFVQKDRRSIELLNSQVDQGKSEINFGVSPFERNCSIHERDDFTGLDRRTRR